MSRIKKKPDEICCLIEINDDETRIKNTLVAGFRMNEKDYLDAMQAYIDEARDNPGSIFDSASAMANEIH